MKKFATPLFFVVLLMIAGPVKAQNWANFSASDFPSRVKSVVFVSGTLSASSSMAWGKWTVSFGPNTGAFFSINVEGFHFVDIKGLRCINSVIGEIPCSMRLSSHPEGARAAFLNAEEPQPYTDGQMIMQIVAPTSLELQ